jgi:hypothetical protein
MTSDRSKTFPGTLSVMKHCAGLIILTIFLWVGMHAQTGQPGSKNKKGVFYFALGSHRIFYTPSTIRVIRASDPHFDFKLMKVKGQDEGGLKFDEAPQFSYTIGYYFKNAKLGIEYQYDHIKYFVRQGQVVHLVGKIGSEPLDQDTVINPDFFQLEHSDGGNYAMINLVKWVPFSRGNKKITIDLMLKAGMGLVNPKSNSTILGKHRDDQYHISGYVFGIESGLRFLIGKYFFVTGSFKGAWANYNHFLIWNGYGKQQWFSGQFNYLFGCQFPL